jgi:exodeoxyribonuclease-3
MRITTWNVNGLRAVLGKGLLEWAEAETPDVLCLQEVRAHPHQIPPEHAQRLQDLYPHALWNPAQRPGYSGVATLARAPAHETRLGLDAPEFDNEGRLIATRYPDFWLFNIYFPNGGRDLARVPYKLSFYERLLEVCDELHAQGQSVIITGDFNTCHQEIDLRHPRPNRKHTGFLDEERDWITRYLSHGFIDIYRQRYPDRVQYTWWAQFANARASNTGWRLDYFLISPALLPHVQDVVIHDDVPGSDHCPVSLYIR